MSGKIDVTARLPLGEMAEQLIAPGPYAFGSSPTLADVYLVPQVNNARRMGVPMESYPKIDAADRACARLDVFRAAAPEAQPDAV